MNRGGLLVLVAIFACGDRKSEKAPTAETRPEPAAAGFEWPEGRWRAELTSPGGPLPFALVVAREGASPAATIENGEETINIASVERDGDAIVFNFPHYDATIRAKVSAGKPMRGKYSVTTASGTTTMGFRAKRGDGRFRPPPANAEAASPVDPTGSWSATFSDADSVYPAVGLFRVEGNVASGSFMTATGDFRFLAGDYFGGVLRLSAFDGAHAFLIQARVRPDGKLEGDFWSLKSYHATWIAERIEEGEDQRPLPDPFAAVAVTSKDKRLRFSFPSLDGTEITNEDERFAGKVVIVELFGTWCSNCNDAAPLLAEWHRRYRARGLEVVGLAFEYTGKPERDMKMVGRYRDKYKIEFPLLLAGVATNTTPLADLSPVNAFPTTIFIGRDGTVRRIHSGFTGPGTGKHYAEMIREMETIIERLLAEPAPDAG